jgi:hypothetical protein
MGGACSTNGDKRYAYTVLVDKPERRRAFERPSRRWEDNIKNDIRVVGWATD